MPWHTNYRGETFVLDQHGRLQPDNNTPTTGRERTPMPISRHEAAALARHLRDSANAYDATHEPVIERIIRDELEALTARRTASQQENTNHA
ncbi:hypothetical protein GCM10028787_10730 [Brachybacterium horti]